MAECLDGIRYGAAMPKSSVDNATTNMLCLWLEPWDTDHWMRPGEQFTQSSPKASPKSLPSTWSSTIEESASG